MASKITSLIGYKAAKAGRGGYVNELFERAYILKKDIEETDGLTLSVAENLTRFFEKKIVQTLFDNNEITSKDFLCGNYVANLLANLVSNIPVSWYAVDYMIDGHNRQSSSVIQDGADLCFVLCSLFKERANFRAMNVKDYALMGARLYYQFYGMTKKEIGYLMAERFNVMTEVTQESIKKLKKTKS